MICPMCNGKGITDLHTPNVGRCIKCNGSGEIEPTNEDFLRTATTEELAKWIANNIKVVIILTHGNREYTENITSEKWWSVWLKQPHSEVEK